MVFMNEKAFLGEFLVFNTAQYTVKKVSGFLVSSRDVTAGNGKTANLFYSVEDKMQSFPYNI